jgi:PAS domain S-box-containing protein
MSAEAKLWGETWLPPSAHERGRALQEAHCFDVVQPAPPREPERLPTDLLARSGCLDKVLESAGDAIVLHDCEGKITFWNAAASQDWGWKAGEAVGKAVGALLFVDQQHYTRIRQALTTKHQWRGNVATMSKSGRLLVRHASISRWEGQGGSGGVLMSCRPAETREADPRAVLRAERLESLASTVGDRLHELNNALSPITMSLDLLRTRLNAPADCLLLDALEEATAWSVRVATDLHNAYRDVFEPRVLERE